MLHNIYQNKIFYSFLELDIKTGYKCHLSAVSLSLVNTLKCFVSNLGALPKRIDLNTFMIQLVTYYCAVDLLGVAF